MAKPSADASSRAVPPSLALALNAKATSKLPSATQLASSAPSDPYSKPMPRPKARIDSHAAAHARFIARMRNATPEERLQSFVGAGILTKTGRFTAPYKELEAYFPRKRPTTAAR